MFIEGCSCEGRTPAGCYVSDPPSKDEQVTDIAPLWGATRGTTPFYKHSTPTGVAVQKRLRMLG